MSNAVLAQLLAVAAHQDGFITAGDVERRRLPRDQIRRMVDSGILERVGPGVLRIAGAPMTWRQDLRAAVLLGRAGAVASHRAAATLLGVDGLAAAPVEITAARRSRGHGAHVIVHRSSDLRRRDTRRVDGIPTTTGTRTIVDLAAVVGIDELEAAYDQMLHRRLTTPERVQAAHATLARKGRNGSAVLGELLSRRKAVIGVSESRFETKLAQVLRRHGLPEPVRQFVLRDDDGRFVARFDAAYPDHRLGIEADSERFHTGRQRFVADRTRRARAEALGWRVPTFTWHHVTREPAFVARTVRGTLHAAGWHPSGDSLSRSVR